MRASRDYPLVQRYTTPMLRVFSEMARMHSAFLHEAVPTDTYEDSMSRCDRLTKAIEARIAEEAEASSGCAVEESDVN